MQSSVNVIENFLSIDECNEIIVNCKNNLTLSMAQVTNGRDDSRKSSVGWVDKLNGINERLSDLLKTSYNINGMEVTGLGPFQFTEYKVGEYFDWHTDRTGDVYRDRFVSTVILLNNNYIGGFLEMLDFDGTLIPINQKVGTLYIFDSGLKHRVTPVENGVRYSLVNWVTLVKNDVKKQNLI